MEGEMSLKISNSKRIIQLDIIRAIAISFVVLCHCVETVYMVTSSGWNAVSEQSGLFMISSFTLGRLGVPLFLFLTGALVLQKNISNDEDVFKFYKKNLIPLIITNTIWIFIYNLFFYIKNDFVDLNIEDLIKEIFFLKQVPFSNMWYMPMIIGIYLVIPFLSKIIKSFSFKAILTLLITIFVTSFIIPFINIWLNINSLESIYSIVDFNFFGGLYGVYIILGYYSYIKKVKIKNWIYILIGVVTFGFTVFIQLYSHTNGNNAYFVWYDFPFLLISALCIFNFLISIKFTHFNRVFDRVIIFVSKASLSFFFIHVIILNLFKDFFEKINIMMPIKVVLLFLITFSICFIISYIISRFRKISKYVILYK